MKFILAFFNSLLALQTAVLSTAASHGPADDPIPFPIRAYWMRRAISALSDLVSLCPFEAFGAVIVNHTASPEGELVCMGVNSIRAEGNPTLHGEIAAINNCSTILTSPDGPYRLSSIEALDAFSKLSLYTTAEACPMCASAIRYGQLAEYIYATSISTLKNLGWPQIDISSHEVFERSSRLPKQTRIVGGVLANETDALFGWQWREEGECPRGCEREGTGSECVPVDEVEGHDEL